MTIETGVVAGNFNRVANELAAMIIDLRVKSGIGHEVLSGYETKLEALKLRAETFLKQLDNQEASQEQINPVSTSQESISISEAKTPETEPDTLAEALAAKIEPAPKTKPEPKIEATAVEELKPSKTKIDNQAFDLVVKQLKDIHESIAELSKKQAKILTILDSQNSKASKPVSFEDYIKAATDKGIKLADQQFKSSLESILNSALQAPKETVIKLMSDLSETVMQRSEVLSKLFTELSTSQSLNVDQRNVLSHLSTYHQSILANPDKETLPSPWTRGMKELFV